MHSDRGPGDEGVGRTPTLRGAHIVLRAPRFGELETLADKIADDPEAGPWWSGNAATILRWLAEGGPRTFVVEVDGSLAGAIMYEEEDDPDYKSASIDVTLLAPWIGKGHGSDALATLARYLFEVRGHHRIQIDPAADNARAISAYERVGFRPVGIMRQYERTREGFWRDSLLMDLLPGELRSVAADGESGT